jgi:Beta-galactosidase
MPSTFGRHRRRPLGRRRSLMALGVALVVSAALTVIRLFADVPSGSTGRVAPVDLQGTQSGALTFGVLGSSCDAGRIAALRQAGVQLVEVGVEWSRFEPAPQQFDQAYIDELRASFARCAEAGIGVVLTPGFQYAPAWVVDLPDGAYVDQFGNASSSGVPNIVFSATVRDAVGQYLDRFSAEFPLDRFAAIRVGTSEAGELGYPAGELGSDGNSYWAFDDAAQTGNGLAAGIGPKPLPGWVPGDRTWNGQPVDAADARSWFDWYAGSAAEAVIWEIDQLRDRGYRGSVHMPLAGRGVLPADLDAAAAAMLDGAADRDGSLERGLFYPDQLAAVAAATRADPAADPDTVFADVTGVDDATAVAARALNPPQDSCRPADATLPLRETSSVETWSATRWTVANARAAGLQVVGENPGPPATAGNGGDDSSDGLAEQLQYAPRYARECGLEVLMWAFEDDLFSPDTEVPLDDLARSIAE